MVNMLVLKIVCALRKCFERNKGLAPSGFWHSYGFEHSKLESF